MSAQIGSSEEDQNGEGALQKVGVILMLVMSGIPRSCENSNELQPLLDRKPKTTELKQLFNIFGEYTYNVLCKVRRAYLSIKMEQKSYTSFFFFHD